MVSDTLAGVLASRRALLNQRVAELQCADVPIRVSRLIGVTAESAPQSRVA